ncbi:IS3 family transposase [Sporosarcina sp. P33]|uniref:IS3 family transposase n=1 Tax=Sporosarcina sp. P33 TaxID=1930764 RepID=UPI003519337E
MGIGQSISCRVNFWDNASRESFLGHFKDETNIKNCEILEADQEIKSYMTYNNHCRGHWNLKKLPPEIY